MKFTLENNRKLVCPKLLVCWVGACIVRLLLGFCNCFIIQLLPVYGLTYDTRIIVYHRDFMLFEKAPVKVGITAFQIIALTGVW